MISNPLYGFVWNNQNPRFFCEVEKLKSFQIYLVLSNMISYNFRDADDAVGDLDGKDMQGGRVRVELARDPRDSRRERGGGGGGFGRGGRDGRRGNPPGPKTNYRLVVENISSRTSWQVRLSKIL